MKEPQSSSDKKAISRRQFLGLAAAGVGGIVAILLGLPLVSSMVTPVLNKKKTESEWVELGEITDFEKDRPVLARWTTRQKNAWVIETTDRVAWVYTKDGQNFTVWNPRCTHLGCAVYYDEQKHTFNSPCHGGIFTIPDGKVIAGPPPRDLDTLPVKTESGKLYTVYKDFKLGVPGKVEL